MANTRRRDFLQLIGVGAITSAMNSSIAKALTIPANNRTGTLEDVEHIVILMQENRPFDHQFGTLRGVRGYGDPRAVQINLPLQNGQGTTPASVFLQPAGATNIANGFSVPPNYGTLGGPANGVPVIPPFRVNPESIMPGLQSLGLTYFPGTDHGWETSHLAWNDGKYDNWPNEKGPIAMSYMRRVDIPYHYALADAFTIGDAYFCSVMGPTNVNRDYMWTGCIGNVDYLGAGGTDGHGAGPATSNGLSPNNAYWVWKTFPETLQAAGITWRVYQDLAGATFAPDFGDGTSNSFAGNYTDNSLLYFNQYATAPTSSPLFQNGCTGTEIMKLIPAAGAPAADWKVWQEHLFDEFRSDVQSGQLPQVSWIVAPAGYTEHPDYPIDYGAWYISQILDILVSNPEVFSKTVFIINYDEADGSFDHVVPPTPPPAAGYGASTVNIQEEIVTDATPAGPIGLGTRVSLLAISPWSKGGYVNSQVFDHTSTIQLIEKRFGVTEENIGPWRRAIAGDMTTLFNFANPQGVQITLPSTDGYLPPTDELAGANPSTFQPTLDSVILGVPAQESGIRPARALPYELHTYGSVNMATSTVDLTFLNTGPAGAVFQVRTVNSADKVRTYTVEPNKRLADSWSVGSSYDISVYGPNGFARYFSGSVGASGAALDVKSRYRIEGRDWNERDWNNNIWGDSCSERVASIRLTITNVASKQAQVTVLDRYTGSKVARLLNPQESFEDEWNLGEFHNWYDLVITVAEDSKFKRQLAGHVETGRDSFSDPVLGGYALID